MHYQSVKKRMESIRNLKTVETVVEYSVFHDEIAVREPIIEIDTRTSRFRAVSVLLLEQIYDSGKKRQKRDEDEDDTETVKRRGEPRRSKC